MYQTFPQNIHILSNAPWHKIEVLMDEINALRRVNFSIVEQRQQALERLNNLPSERVFEQDSRFKFGSYVCEMWGDWPRKMQQLKSALSFKERQVEKKDALPDLSSFQDAQMAFWNSTTNIIDQLVRLDGVFDREKFENYFSLEWAALEEAAPH